MKRPPAELAARLRAAADDALGAGRAPSVDDMAARAGVARATLYYYFSGRDELLDFLLLDKVERIGAAVRAASENDEDPAAALEAALSGVVETIADHPALCTMLLSRLPALTADDVLRVAVERSVLRPLRDLLDSGVTSGRFELDDPELSAHALYGAVAMAAQAQLARSGRVDAEQLRSALVPQLAASVRRR